jgi:hypothetical protein
MTRTDNHRGRPRWNFRYTYDAVNKAELYEHDQDNGDEICAVSIVEDGAACNLLNAADGHAYVVNPSTGACCVYPASAHVGMILPNWLERTNATLFGYTNVTVGGQNPNKPNQKTVSVAQWVTPDDGVTRPNWYLVSTDPESAGVPVMFWEKSADEHQPSPWLKRWDWQLETLLYGPPKDPSVLLPPKACRGLTECVVRHNR